MTGTTELLDCPMCDFAVLPTDEYFLQLHFEQIHTTDSPFRVIEEDPRPPSLPERPHSALSTSESQLTPSSNDNETTFECPECPEFISLPELNEHLDYHLAETLSFDETTGKYRSQNRAKMHGPKSYAHHAGQPSFHEQDYNTESPEALRRHGHHGRRTTKKVQRGRSDTTGSEKSTLSRSMQTFNPFAKADKKVKPPSGTCRLGRAELGPHAWEDRMPKWLHDQLDAGPKITVVNRIGRDGRLIKHEHVQNETPGIIPILAQLSALDRSVKEAYYCHPSTLHVGKTPKEGGFCGYRNIQMLVSYIQGARAQGYEEFPGRTPGILKLQDLIERAWDKGINTIGRQQTGGIRDTRKYIGTPEAQALFLSAQIDCGVQMFSDAPDGSIEAHDSLLATIEQYFAKAATSDGSNVYKTLLPPIYLQQPGHSITIVGFERRRDGSSNLMVFDPMYSTSPAMHKLIGRKDIKSHRPEVLHAYRRMAKQLKKHAAFEILMLTAHPPLFPAWDVLRQFPDLRYLYAFFRSRTLGFDVYPVDRFLRNFPWQQYGGLWIVDEARFARSDSINPFTAQALRRITGEGTSTSYSSPSQSDSLNTGWYDNYSHHLPSMPLDHRTGVTPKPQVSLMTYSDKRVIMGMEGMVFDRGGADIAPVLDMVGMHTAVRSLDRTSARPQQAKLSLLTDIGRQYPGYPNALSPTFDAKQLFPSPDSETGSGIMTPRAATPIFNPMEPTDPVSPMSIDNSTKLGQSYLDSPKSNAAVAKATDYEVLARVGVITEQDMWNNKYAAWKGWTKMKLVPEARIGGIYPFSAPPHTPPCSPATTTTTPIPPSPPYPMSPRSAMLRNMADKQAFQSLSHQPSTVPTSPPDFWYPSPPSEYLGSFSSPAIPIANGFEMSMTSPFDPTGTMLKYTSKRGVDSGLLALKPLSESQVAEYRFWRPCGRRSCAFGCGGESEGENRAARRLFRSAEEVRLEEEEICEESVVSEKINREGERERERKMEQESMQVRGEEEREAKMEEEMEGVRIVLNSDGEEVVEIRV